MAVLAFSDEDFERATGDGVYTVRDLADMPSADEDYLVGDGIITKGGKVLIYGKSGGGKTTLLDFLAGPLATGRPFLSRFAIDRPRRVLVIQGELSLPEMASHAQGLISAGFETPDLLFARMTRLKLPAGEDELRELILRHRAQVIALDPWYRLFSGESSNQPEQVDVVFGVIDRLLDDGLVEAAVVVHHANATGLRTAGSWLFEGWPSTILNLAKVEGLPADRIVSFEKIRAPGSSLQDTRLHVRLGEAGYAPVDVASRPDGAAGAILARAIVAEAGGQLHRKQLITGLMARAHCKERAANKYLGQALQERKLRTVRDGAETLYCLVIEEVA